MRQFSLAFDMGQSGQAGAPPYVAPTIPVSTKCGYFLIGDDIVNSTTWAPRKDIFSQGNPTIINGSVNASGWSTPEGSRKTITGNGTSTYMRLNGLASMAAPDDPPYEIYAWYKINSTNSSNTLLSFSSTSSSTPKRVLAFTTGPYRVTQQSTTSVFAHNATNLLQQMVGWRSVNNGAGTDIRISRNCELDPINGTGILTANVAAQAVNTFTIFAQDNGGSIVNFAAGELFALWVRDPAAAPLINDEELELHNFMMGGYNAPPLYSTPTSFLLMMNFGQSLSLSQGIATGAVAGLPDPIVKEMMRSLNNTAVDPIALQNLDLRGTVHGAQHYLQRGTFAKPHHMAGVGKGATNAGSDWGGQNGAGPTNSLQGYYSTYLPSEVRRNIFMAKARFGGAPSVQCTMWQGENDASGGSVVAGQFFNNHTAIRAYIRAYILRAFGQSVVPYHMMKLNRVLQTGGGIVQADLDTINTAIDSLASGDANTFALNAWSSLTNPAYIQVDNLHASDAGYQQVYPGVVASIKAADGSL